MGKDTREAIWTGRHNQIIPTFSPPGQTSKCGRFSMYIEHLQIVDIPELRLGQVS